MGTHCSVLGRRCGVTPSFTVRVKEGFASHLGYATSGANDDPSFHYWVLDCKHGILSSGNQEHTEEERKYTDVIKVNSTVTLCFDKMSETISYEVDGVSGGVAFRDVPCNNPLLPVIMV